MHNKFIGGEILLNIYGKIIPQKKWSSHHGQQESEMQYLDAISKTIE